MATGPSDTRLPLSLTKHGALRVFPMASHRSTPGSSNYDRRVLDCRRNPGRTEPFHLALVLGKVPVRILRNKSHKYRVSGSIIVPPTPSKQS